MSAGTQTENLTFNGAVPAELPLSSPHVLRKRSRLDYISLPPYMLWRQKVVSAYERGYVFRCLFFFQELFLKCYLSSVINMG